MAKINTLDPSIAERFELKNNTLARVVKASPERKIELEIGDSKQPDFKPQFKTSWFGGEYNRSIRAEEHPDVVVKTDGDKIIYERPDGISVIQYEKPDAGQEGGHELEWKLDRKPDLSGKVFILPFTLRYKGDVRFYRQHAISPRNKTPRPPHIAGSYAVYIDKKNHILGQNNYASGKIEHIFRPKAIDANGNEVWCELFIPESSDAETNIECRVEVPTGFLENASYPVLVDPTFGYTTIPTADDYQVGSNQAQVCRFPLSENGDVVSIHIYGRANASGSRNVKGVIYDDDGASSYPATRMVVGAEIAVNSTTDQWWVSNASVSLTAGSFYLGAVVANQTAPTLRMWFDDGPNLSKFSSLTYTNPNNPFPGGADEFAEIDGVYATYTTGGTDYTRSIADTPSITDSRARQVGFNRQVADTASVTDSRSKVSSYIRNQSDQAGITDSVSYSLVRLIEVALSESLVITDSVQQSSSFSRSQADSTQATDSLEYILSQIIAVSLSDSLSVTDSSSRVVQLTREMLENVNAQDFITRIFSANIAISNTLGVSDSLAQSLLMQRSLSDIQSVADAISFEIVIPSNQDGGNAPVIDSVIDRLLSSYSPTEIYDNQKMYDTHTPYYAGRTNDIAPTVLTSDQSSPYIEGIIINLSEVESEADIYDDNKMYNTHYPYYSAKSNDIAPTVELE